MDPVITCLLGKVPFTLEDLVSRPDIVPIGMLLQDDGAAWNSSYFNHMAGGCGTTFTVKVAAPR